MASNARLRLGQIERDLEVSIERDFGQVLLPDAARIAAQVVGFLAVAAVERALHVLAGDGPVTGR